MGEKEEQNILLQKTRLHLNQLWRVTNHRLLFNVSFTQRNNLNLFFKRKGDNQEERGNFYQYDLLALLPPIQNSNTCSRGYGEGARSNLSQ